MIKWSKYKFESKGCTIDCKGLERKEVVPDTSKLYARFPKFQMYPEDSQDSFESLGIRRIPRRFHEFQGKFLWVDSVNSVCIITNPESRKRFLYTPGRKGEGNLTPLIIRKSIDVLKSNLE